MKINNSTQSWGLVSILFHWISAFVIFYVIGVGIYMTYFVSGPLEQFSWVQTHKSWGFIAFVLILARLLWRSASGPTPHLPKEMRGWEKKLAHAGHWGVYILLFLIPVSGWLMASSSPLQETFGIKNMVFDWFEMPDPFIPGDKGVSAFFKQVHFYSLILFGFLLVGHIGAALMHHFVRKDNVLKRMIKG